MKQKNIICYQIERRRERSGKVIKPQPFIFEHMLEGYIRNHEEIENVTLLPLTFNYDQIYEGIQFPYELIGDEGKRESIFQMLKTFFWTSEKFGRVHVKYGKPISLKEKIGEFISERNVEARLFFSRYYTGLSND
jgi:glycerol-3-phosphate O-acyltransferase